MTGFDAGKVLADLVEMLPHNANCDKECDQPGGFDCRAGYLQNLVDYIVAVGECAATETKCDAVDRLTYVTSRIQPWRFGKTTSGIPFVTIALPEIMSVLLGRGDDFDAWLKATDWGRHGALPEPAAADAEGAGS